MNKFKNFTRKMGTKAKEKIGATHTTELIILILVVIVIIGTLVMPAISKMVKKGFDATDKKMDQIIEYVG